MNCNNQQNYNDKYLSNINHFDTNFDNLNNEICQDISHLSPAITPENPSLSTEELKLKITRLEQKLENKKKKVIHLKQENQRLVDLLGKSHLDNKEQAPEPHIQPQVELDSEPQSTPEPQLNPDLIINEQQEGTNTQEDVPVTLENYDNSYLTLQTKTGEAPYQFMIRQRGHLQNIEEAQTTVENGYKTFQSLQLELGDINHRLDQWHPNLASQPSVIPLPPPPMQPKPKVSALHLLKLPPNLSASKPLDDNQAQRLDLLVRQKQIVDQMQKVKQEILAFLLPKTTSNRVHDKQINNLYGLFNQKANIEKEKIKEADKEKAKIDGLNPPKVSPTNVVNKKAKTIENQSPVSEKFYQLHQKFRKNITSLEQMHRSGPSKSAAKNQEKEKLATNLERETGEKVLEIYQSYLEKRTEVEKLGQDFTQKQFETQQTLSQLKKLANLPEEVEITDLSELETAFKNHQIMLQQQAAKSTLSTKKNQKQSLTNIPLSNNRLTYQLKKPQNRPLSSEEQEKQLKERTDNHRLTFYATNREKLQFSFKKDFRGYQNLPEKEQIQRLIEIETSITSTSSESKNKHLLLLIQIEAEVYEINTCPEHQQFINAYQNECEKYIKRQLEEDSKKN